MSTEAIPGDPTPRNYTVSCQERDASEGTRPIGRLTPTSRAPPSSSSSEQLASSRFLSMNRLCMHSPVWEGLTRNLIHPAMTTVAQSSFYLIHMIIPTQGCPQRQQTTFTQPGALTCLNFNLIPLTASLGCFTGPKSVRLSIPQPKKAQAP